MVVAEYQRVGRVEGHTAHDGLRDGAGCGRLATERDIRRQAAKYFAGETSW
jgi:hypothetical protein